MNRRLLLHISCAIVFGTGLAFPPAALGFCGFYVATADTKLFNKASQVVLVREGDYTALTMVNDFQGDLKEFAVVIPVPTVIKREQIKVLEKTVIDHLDAYTAPRLVEYFDPDPCRRQERMLAFSAAPMSRARDAAKADSLGVKIEAEYTVGEYDILILSANESDGLETWLKENGYKIPSGASDVLGSYIKQNMRFFVARVNLQEQRTLGFSYLRPLQVQYNTPKFMLPIRLGTVNANGPQELFIYALSRKGRVETINYRTVKLPSDMDLPLFIKNEFARFYKDMFSEQVRKEDMRVVFQEYAWDMGWCDPCAAEPLSSKELTDLGVSWITAGNAGVRPSSRSPAGGAQNVYVTRLHVRYDAKHFPEDLVFQETGDRRNFQGRYVLRHPWKGSSDCPEARTYFENLNKRRRTEAETLAKLTGWKLDEILEKVDFSGRR